MSFLQLPTPPTHSPIIPKVSMKDIQDTLTNMGIVMKFANYMWNKYCKLFGEYCTYEQKRYIEKYRLWKSPTAPPQDQIIQDLSNFAMSRGSTIYIEFENWIKQLSDIEFRLIMVQKGGVSSSKRRGYSRRQQKRSKSKRTFRA